MVADAGRHPVAEADEPVVAPAPQVPAGGSADILDRGTVIPLRRRWYQRPATLIAAAIAIALVVSGIVIANRPGSGTENMATMESCVATAADAQVLTPTVGAGGNVRYAPSCGAATVTLPEVPDAPQGMGYQMWVMTGPTAAPVGMVTTGATGTPDPMTFEVQDPATDIGVSVEPAAGSTTPTTDRSGWCTCRPDRQQRRPAVPVGLERQRERVNVRCGPAGARGPRRPVGRAGSPFLLGGALGPDQRVVDGRLDRRRQLLEFGQGELGRRLPVQRDIDPLGLPFTEFEPCLQGAGRSANDPRVAPRRRRLMAAGSSSCARIEPESDRPRSQRSRPPVDRSGSSSMSPCRSSCRR